MQALRSIACLSCNKPQDEDALICNFCGYTLHARGPEPSTTQFEGWGMPVEVVGQAPYA